MSYVLLIIIAILGWGVSSFFYTVANQNIHPIMVSTIVAGVYVVITPLAFLFLKFDHQVNLIGVGFAVLGAICAAAGSLGYFYLLRTGSGGLITALTALYPALTLGLTAIFLRETINPKQAVGMGLALVSFVLLNLK